MDYLNIIWILLISFGINYFCFIFAWFLKSDAFTDITYALTFALIIWIYFIWSLVINGSLHFSQILIFLLINAWAVQLGSYLFIRILKMKKDRRFDGIRESFKKFFLFWTFQALTVFIVILPCALYMTIPATTLNSYGWMGGIILAFALFGLIYEGIADAQKRKFYRERKADGGMKQFLKTGLWKSSRHPNYFGELTFWFSMTIATMVSFLASDPNPKSFIFLVFIISPVFLWFMMNFVSGIKRLEAGWIKEYQGNADFHQYIMKTSVLLPFIGRKGYFDSRDLPKN